MDIFALMGAAGAIACIAIGMLLDGGNLDALLQLPAFVVVMGGTVGAMLLQTPFNTFLAGVKMLTWIWMPPEDDSRALLDMIMEWVRISRRESILALDRIAEEETDPIVRQGLRLVVDGVDAPQIRAMLETMVHTLEHHELMCCEIYESMGGYAPTIGVLGAVLGLITVMSHLADPSKLGSGIATAFVATVYGVGSANLIFLPIAGKLRTIVRRRVRRLDMAIEGIIGMAVMEKPIYLELKLRSFLYGADGMHAEPKPALDDDLTQSLPESEDALEGSRPV